MYWDGLSAWEELSDNYTVTKALTLSAPEMSLRKHLSNVTPSYWKSSWLKGSGKLSSKPRLPADGVWEIRAVRNVLNATVAQCPGRLDDASLRMLLYEAIANVNSHPLTVDGINDPQVQEHLTPNHLLMKKSKATLPPPGVFVKEDLYATKWWRRVQYLIKQFWGHWRKEHLLNISTRQEMALSVTSELMLLSLSEMTTSREIIGN